MKNFWINFIISTIVWVISLCIGGLVALLYWPFMWGDGWLINIIGRDGARWLFYLVWYGGFVIFTSLSIILFFVCGKRLHLLRKQWLNYMSVCGSVLVVIALGILTLFDSIVMIAIVPFGMLWAVVELQVIRSGSDDISITLFFFIVALPSIITWLGMVHQAKKNKKKIIVN